MDAELLCALCVAEGIIPEASSLWSIDGLLLAQIISSGALCIMTDTLAGGQVGCLHLAKQQPGLPNSCNFLAAAVNIRKAGTQPALSYALRVMFS